MARTSPHPGSTKLEDNNQIKIVYDAEVKDVGICEKLMYCCICQKFERQRSYLYVRENSLETNLALSCICCDSWISESTNVHYFDRSPFKPSYRKFPWPCCMVPIPCCWTEPKLDVQESGCWCCCQRIVLCEKVVVMPFEHLAFPCCCCTNRSKHFPCCCWCGGIPCPLCPPIVHSLFCKCCGVLEDVPKVVDSFAPQPKDPWAFVAAFGKAANMNIREKPGQHKMTSEEVLGADATVPGPVLMGDSHCQAKEQSMTQGGV